MANELRDDIELLKERNALLEASAEHTRRYGFEVKKGEERSKVLNQKLEDIMKNEKQIVDIQRSRKNLGEQLTQMSKDYGDNLLKQFGIEGSINDLKEGANTNDKEQLRQSKELADILDGVLKGELDHLDVREKAIGLTGKFREAAENAADALQNTPDLQKKMAVKQQLIQAVSGMVGGIDKTIKGIMAATGPIGLLIAAAGFLVTQLIAAVKRGIELRRELGTSVVETGKLVVNMEAAAVASAMFGGTLEKGRDAVKELVMETGLLEDINLRNSAALGKFSANSGLAAGEQAKLLKVMKMVTGNSVAQNINLLEGAESIARSEGVLKSRVFTELASNTELFARAGAKGASALQRAAVEAAKIGTNLSALDSLADNLLDVQKTIRTSTTLSRVLGRNIDLTQAIGAANRNDLQGLQAEISNQFGGMDFSELTRFQQNLVKEGLGLDLQTVQALSRGQTPAENLTPPVAKDQLSAQNQTNELLSKQASDIKALREENAELLGKLNNSVKRLKG